VFTHVFFDYFVPSDTNSVHSLDMYMTHKQWSIKIAESRLFA